MRRRVFVIAIAMVAVPTYLLGVRIADPSVGQQNAGWQMHTSCWGQDPPCR